MVQTRSNNQSILYYGRDLTDFRIFFTCKLIYILNSLIGPGHMGI